jgi:hypothetical protein
VSIIDPPPAPEAGKQQHMKAGDLKNKYCILRPTSTGQWEPRDGKEGNPYVACEVWTLDRAGILEHDTSVWISWWKAIAQLKNYMGQLVACRPVEQEDRSIELTPLTGEARIMAEKVAGEIESGSADIGGGQEPDPGFAPGEEPF